MSFSDTACLLTGSRHVIENVTNECNDNDIMLIQIYSLLTKMNSKQTNIEIKNSALEFRLTEIEKKITAIGHREHNIPDR